MSTRKQSDDDFAQEILAHIELETERLIHEGMTPDEARVAARRRFGNVTSSRERFYEAGRLLWLDHLLQDIRCAARNLRRYPIAALVAVLSLAAGIGATTVTLTIRNVIFRNPPPLYRQPGQLSNIQIGTPQNPIRPVGNAVPVPLFLAWREGMGPVMAASTAFGERTIRTSDRTDTFSERAVTPELFAVLGVAPEIGVAFDAKADITSGPAPAILSARAWHQLFDQRSDVLGQVFWIDDRPHTIIGVMPRQFWYADMDSPIWTRLDVRTLIPDTRVGVIVRRPDGVTPSMLESQLQPALAEYAARLPASERQMMIRASGVEGTPIGNQMSFVLPYVLGVAVLLTLIIACANVAILMIAQWTAREQEIAIRASIGATRGRIVRALLTESILIAVCGGALGVCVTLMLRAWILHGSGGSRFFDLTIDSRIFIETAAITVMTGVLAGIVPALHETRRLHLNPLRTLATSDRIRQRWRHTLVILEITVTIALLVVTSTMIEGYWRTVHGQMGFASGPLMTARVDNPNGVPSRQILDVLRRMPGVTSAAASTSVPTRAAGRRVSVAAAAGGSESLVVERGDITEDFFATLGVPMRAGRAFSTTDTAVSRVAIVNETVARLLYRGPERGRFEDLDCQRSVRRHRRGRRLLQPPAARRNSAAASLRAACRGLSGNHTDAVSDPLGRRPRRARAGCSERDSRRGGGHGLRQRRDGRSSHRGHGPGSDGRHRTALSSRDHRAALDDGRNLRRARVRDCTSIARTRDPRGRRRKRSRRGGPRRQAHPSTGRCRFGTWNVRHVRPGSRRPLGRRCRQHLGSVGAGVRLAGRSRRRRRSHRDVDSCSSRACDRSGHTASTQ